MSEQRTLVQEAIILAGGQGSRLRSEVPALPKILAPVLGRPFVCYLLDQLQAIGIRRVILATGYGAEFVEDALGTEYPELSLEYSREKTPLGTGGAIALASEKLSRRQVLVTNGDSVLLGGLEILSSSNTQEHPATLVASRVQRSAVDQTAIGEVLIDERGRISDFLEKGQKPAATSPYLLMNAGVYLLPAEWLKALSREKPSSLEREILPSWLIQGVYCLQTEQEVLDIGTPDNYRSAAERLAR